MRYNRQSEQGFTIVELMIAVLIGLIVSAAAAQIYATSIRTGATQKAALWYFGCQCLWTSTHRKQSAHGRFGIKWCYNH